MNNFDTHQFIDRLKQLWTEWTPTDAEADVWCRKIIHFDYKVLAQAAEDYYFDAGGRFKKPNPHGIITKAQVIQDGSPRKLRKEHPLTNVFIECLEPPERNENLKGCRKAVYAETVTLQADPDYLRDCAESMRKKFEDIYGGKWITIIEKTPEDDGLRGKQAKAQAYKNILNGPDTAGKKWLLGYLHPDKAKPKTEGKLELEMANAF